jgi:hypothetical protein
MLYETIRKLMRSGGLRLRERCAINLRQIGGIASTKWTRSGYPGFHKMQENARAYADASAHMDGADSSSLSSRKAD